MHKAMFLDRDGTVIEHVHYLNDPAGVRLVSDCVKALSAARAAGYLLVVISNQSIIGRGTGTKEEVDACNARMEELLRVEGIMLDLVLYCPHAPEEECGCRKPKPGMLLDAADRLGIDLSQSVMIGDNITDVEAGENAGCAMSLYLNTREPRVGDACFDSLEDAVRSVLEPR